MSSLAFPSLMSTTSHLGHVRAAEGLRDHIRDEDCAVWIGFGDLPAQRLRSCESMACEGREGSAGWQAER